MVPAEVGHAVTAVGTEDTGGGRLRSSSAATLRMRPPAARWSRARKRMPFSSLIHSIKR